MNSEQPLKSIIIVGGGTAGWSAAACLSRFLENQPVDITLIESSKIGTVGVGEASIPNLRNFNTYVGLSEVDFLKDCKSTFKLGIRFDDWSETGRQFFHPFGDYGVPIGGVDFFDVFMAQKPKGPYGELSSFSLPIQMSALGRFAQPQPSGSPLANFGYAYHFSAIDYARALKSVSVNRGVRAIDGLVTDTLVNSQTGFIEHLTLDGGARISGDLFVDCTGFRGLLIEEALSAGYEDWSSWLPVDRAIAVQTSSSPDGRIDPFTVATARSAGWSWRIPLQSRIGNGYVYSSQFKSDDEAYAELLSFIEGTPLAEPNVQRFKSGMRRTFWKKNCIALGLASGFIEPLESTSINLIHRALSIFMDFFPDKTFDATLCDEANAHFAQEQIRVRDFIIAHYILSSREDTPFWRHVRNVEPPTDLQRKLATYKSIGRILSLDYESFEPASWRSIYAGFGIVPERTHPRVSALPRPAVDEMLSKLSQAVAHSANTAPPHADFIRSILDNR